MSRLTVEQEVELRAQVKTLEKEVERMDRLKAEAEIATTFLARTLGLRESGIGSGPALSELALLKQRVDRLELDLGDLRALYRDLEHRYQAREGKYNSPVSASTLVGLEEGEIPLNVTKTSQELKLQAEEAGEGEEEEEDDGLRSTSSYDNDVPASLSSSFSAVSDKKAYINRFVKDEVQDKGNFGSSATSAASSASPTSLDSANSSSAEDCKDKPKQGPFKQGHGNRHAFGPHRRGGFNSPHVTRNFRPYNGRFINVRDHPSIPESDLEIIKLEPYVPDKGPQEATQLFAGSKEDSSPIAFRAVIIHGLPRETKIDKVLSLVRGGIVVEATIFDTSSFFNSSSSSAIVWFYHAEAAAAFIASAKKTPLKLEDTALQVKPLSTSTWPLTKNMIHNIEVVGCRRAFTVTNLPPKALW